MSNSISFLKLYILTTRMQPTILSMKSLKLHSLLTNTIHCFFFISELKLINLIRLLNWNVWPSTVIPSLDDSLCSTLKRLPLLFLEIPTLRLFCPP